MHGYFKRQTVEISHKKTGVWPRKENLERETESLLIVVQNNVIRTKFIKVKIDYSQRVDQEYFNSRLWGEKEKLIT